MAKKKSFLIRIDQKLFDELRRWADDELRSVNAQIEFVLRRAMSDRSGAREKGEEDEDED